MNFILMSSIIFFGMNMKIIPPYVYGYSTPFSIIAMQSHTSPLLIWRLLN